MTTTTTTVVETTLTLQQLRFLKEYLDDLATDHRNACDAEIDMDDSGLTALAALLEDLWTRLEFDRPVTLDVIGQLRIVRPEE